MKRLSVKCLLCCLLLTLCASGALGASLSKAIIKAEAECTYDGTAQTPGLIVKVGKKTLREGTDYTAEYSDNVNAGTARVTVTGTGDYSGTAKGTFLIKKADCVITAEDITVEWKDGKQTLELPISFPGDGKVTLSTESKAVTLDGTRVTVRAKFLGRARINVTVAGTDNYKKGTASFRIVGVPETPKLESTRSRASSSVFVDWHTAGGATKYEIEYDTDPAFSAPQSVTVAQRKGTQTTLEGLTPGSLVYVRIRSVYVAEKLTLYSDWMEPAECEIPLNVLFTFSDYQSNKKENAFILLDTMMKNAKAMGFVPDRMLIGGDYSSGNGFGEDPVWGLREMRYRVEQSYPDFNTDVDGDLIFIRGNHDLEHDRIREDGLYDFGSYLVYCANCPTMFPFTQGTHGKDEYDIVVAGAEKVRRDLKPLIEKGETRPVFFMTHVPLHFSNWTAASGDNLYMSFLAYVLQEAAETLNIVYFFGHNHGVLGDSSIGAGSIFLKPGDTLYLPDLSEASYGITFEYTPMKLNFIYMNYGYIGYLGTKERVGDMAQTMGIIKVYADRVEFSRIDTEGSHVLGAKGVRAPDSKWPEDYLSEEIKRYTLWLDGLG